MEFIEGETLAASGGAAWADERARGGGHRHRPVPRAVGAARRRASSPRRQGAERDARGRRAHRADGLQRRRGARSAGVGPRGCRARRSTWRRSCSRDARRRRRRIPTASACCSSISCPATCRSWVRRWRTCGRRTARASARGCAICVRSCPTPSCRSSSAQRTPDPAARYQRRRTRARARRNARAQRRPCRGPSIGPAVDDRRRVDWSRGRLGARIPGARRRGAARRPARSTTCPGASPPIRVTIGPPYNTAGWPRLSPDGRLVVYGTVIDGRPVLWVRPLDSDQGRPLAGTTALESPFWSPDSRLLALLRRRQAEDDRRRQRPDRDADRCRPSARRRLEQGRRHPLLLRHGHRSDQRGRQPAPARDRARRDAAASTSTGGRSSSRTAAVSCTSCEAMPRSRRASIWDRSTRSRQRG